MNAFNKNCSVETSTSCALPSPGRPAVRLRAPARRHHRGGSVSAEKRGHRTGKKRTRRSGELRREPVVTPLKTLGRRSKATRGGRDLAPAESHNILTSHTCSQTLLSTFTSPLSVRTVCVPMEWYHERVRFRSFHHRPQPPAQAWGLS